MASRVLVTGGAGYVGRFIVEELLQAGYEVTIAGRNLPDPGMFARPVGFLPFSLEPATISAGTLEGFDAIVHAAFHHVPDRYRGGEGADPATFCQFNLDGSLALFEAAKTAGIKRCVFLSSRAVYGWQAAGVLLAEEMPCHPDTLYGKIKLAAEQALTAMSTPAFVTASLRVTGVYGMSGGTHKWASLFDDFSAGRPIEPRIGTEVHGRDVGTAVRLMLSSEPATVGGKVFNVSDILLDRRDLLGLVNELAGMNHPLPEAADANAYNAMSTERLRALGWAPGGRDLLRRTVGELISHQQQRRY